MYKKKYLIEDVEVPNEEMYDTIVELLERIKVDENEWYRVRPTETLIKGLIAMLGDPEKKNILLKEIKGCDDLGDLDWNLTEHIGGDCFPDGKLFNIEFSEEECGLIEKIGLFTVEEALQVLNRTGLWRGYKSSHPNPDHGITEGDIINEKRIKTMHNIKRGYRI